MPAQAQRVSIPEPQGNMKPNKADSAAQETGDYAQPKKSGSYKE